MNQSYLMVITERDKQAILNWSLFNVKTIFHYKRMLLYTNIRTLLAKSTNFIRYYDFFIAKINMLKLKELKQK